MIRLPTSEEEAAHMGETFQDDNSDEAEFHDEDDDIPPAVKGIKATENEEDFFSVSDDEEEEETSRPATNDEGTKAWRD
jgi:hypothetical protein